MDSFINHVENRTNAELSGRLTVNAAVSFLNSMRQHRIEEVKEDSLRMWFVDMTLNGLRKSTRKKYFSRIHTLYREWRSAPSEDPFEALKDDVNLDYESGLEEAEANRLLVDRLLKNRPDNGERDMRDVFFYLLYDVGATLHDAVNLKFGDDIADCMQLDDLIESIRKISQRKKYVFGLNQGKMREPQIMRELVGGMHSMLKNAGMRFEKGFSRESITAIWIAAAIKSGVCLQDIRSMTATIPSGFEALRLISPSQLTDRQRGRLTRRVADSINDKTSQWFVMRMRSGNTPDDIKQKISQTIPETYADMLFYYPTHKVVKKNVKGRTVSEETPYLPGVLFFKMGRDKVTPLFNKIGDIAWCYKWSKSPESPYCTISSNDMKTFQRHIGQFTPDIRMEFMTREQPLAKGSEVVIRGGGFMEGHIGVIESVKNADGTRTYTLTLSEKEYATWTVSDIDEAFIEPHERDGK